MLMTERQMTFKSFFWQTTPSREQNYDDARKVTQLCGSQRAAM
jgi:hypothetical protein